MNFNFVGLQAIKKLALTKAQSHDKTLIKEFRKKNNNQ